MADLATEKTALVPARKLSQEERRSCRRVWSTVKISDRERLLGIYLGLEATIEDQYDAALEKLDSTLRTLDKAREGMSQATRIVVANVFLVSLLQFPNRHFWMPEGMLAEVRGKLLNFVTRMKFVKLGLF